MSTNIAQQKRTHQERNIQAHKCGINLRSRREMSAFHWLMVAILLTKPIKEEVAVNVLKTLRRYDFDTPEDILRAGWQKIIRALNEANYTRYAESTATELIELSEQLIEEYDGHMRILIDRCTEAHDLYHAIQRFKGIGPTGAQIFMREIEPIYYRYYQS